MVGALPPPGFYLLNYLDFFNSHQLNNNSGNIDTSWKREEAYGR
jgi:hypothetical protein